MLQVVGAFKKKIMRYVSRLIKSIPLRKMARKKKVLWLLLKIN